MHCSELQRTATQYGTSIGEYNYCTYNFLNILNMVTKTRQKAMTSESLSV